MSLDDLADEVAVMVSGKPSDEISEEDTDKVLRGLHHTHVPMLVSANLVDYDQPEAMVSIRESAERAAPFLALVSNENATVA